MKYRVKYYRVKRLTWTDQLEPPVSLKKSNRINQLHHYRDSENRITSTTFQGAQQS
jgi:hypothetical protein